VALAVVTRMRIRALLSAVPSTPTGQIPCWLVPSSNGAHPGIHPGPPCRGNLALSRCDSPRAAQAPRRPTSR
jgi:hypothetical protein